MTSNEDRLRQALRNGAHVRPTTDDDVSELRHRLAGRTSMVHASNGRWIRWRTPLVAAAAVVAVAVTVSAIATGGFGAGRQESASPNATGGTGGGSDEMGGTRVPIIPASAGTVIQPAIGGFASPTSSATRTSRSPSTASGDPAGHMLIRVGAGALSNSITMEGMLVARDGSTISGEGVQSDGTSLGLVGVLGRTSAHDAYIWGAVPTDVHQLQILASPRAGSGNAATTTRYVVASGRSDPTDLGPPTGTTPWTDLGDGWHGFALQLPDSAQQVDIYAFTSGMRTIQGVRITVQSGATTELPAIATTGTPPPHISAIPSSDIDWSSLTAATPPPGTVGVDSPAPGTGSGAAPRGDSAISPKGATDWCWKLTGSRPDLAVVIDDADPPVVCFVLNADESELRFFAGGHWHAVEPVNGPQDQVMRFFGVTPPGPQARAALGQSSGVARFVFGIVGPDVTHITTTDGIRQIGTLHAIDGTDLRAFVMLSGPQAGSVTVSDDADHQMTGTVNGAATESTRATPTS